MLGNSVVPMTARLAFVRMLSGFSVLTVEDMARKREVVFVAAVPEAVRVAEASGCKHGEARHSERFRVRVEHGVADRPTPAFVVDPAHYRTAKQFSYSHLRGARSPLVEKHEQRLWPTLRLSALTKSHVLSKRTRQDLATLVMYVSDVGGRRQRCTVDSDSINPRFAEWLMGFPLDHTR